MGTPDWMATGIWLLGWDGKYIYIYLQEWLSMVCHILQTWLSMVWLIKYGQESVSSKTPRNGCPGFFFAFPPWQGTFPRTRARLEGCLACLLHPLPQPLPAADLVASKLRRERSQRSQSSARVLHFWGIFGGKNVGKMLNKWWKHVRYCYSKYSNTSSICGLETVTSRSSYPPNS